MVKVEGLGQRKIESMEKVRGLAKITRDTVGRFRTFAFKDLAIIQVSSVPFIPYFRVSVFPDNIIWAKSPRYLNTAIRLAEAYENAGEEEFTVQKRYIESPAQQVEVSGA